MIFFDALRVKIRDESVVKNKVVYLALALDCEGQKHRVNPFVAYYARARGAARSDRPAD